MRNRGTIGGSLAHADPHADLPAALLARRRLGDGAQRLRLAARSRRPTWSSTTCTTSLAEDELIVDVRLPADAGQSAYAKFHRRGDRLVDRRRRRRPSAAATSRCAITGLGSRPVRATGFEEVVNGGGSLDEAARRAGEGTVPIDDLDGSAEYKRHLAGVLAKRALAEARG